jgi:hypothetical protein
MFGVFLCASALPGDCPRAKGCALINPSTLSSHTCLLGLPMRMCLPAILILSLCCMAAGCGGTMISAAASAGAVAGSSVEKQARGSRVAPDPVGRMPEMQPIWGLPDPGRYPQTLVPGLGDPYELQAPRRGPTQGDPALGLKY